MRCKYIRKIFQNEENGYTVALFSTLDHEVPLSARDKFWADKKIIAFTAKGYDLPLTDEIEIEMEGEWETSSYGTQYKVETFLEVVPRTREGILGYLSSGAIKGIGPKMADTIFRKFGLQTLEIMENNPQELLKIRGISEKKLAAIVESYGKNQVFRELMTFLAPFKVTPKKVNMILKKFGNESVDIIRHRPYMLSAVKGFGFLTVDAIGRQCCCALNDPMRISGCIGHIMNQAMKEGHLFKQRQEVIREALEMLNRDLQVMAVSEQDVSQVLYRLVLQKSIVVEEERIYSIRQYEEETQTASMIARRLLEKPVLLSIEPELEKAQKTLGITLSETQKQAVRMVFAHPISIITGGPGTGKTFIASGLVHEAVKEGYNAALISLEDLLVCLKTKDVSRHAMKTYKRIMKARLLAIDNVTLYPLKREDMLLLFKLVNTLQEKVSLIIIANRGLAEWLEELGDEAVAAALLDRLLYCCEVINLSGKSYRLENRKTIFSNQT